MKLSLSKREWLLLGLAGTLTLAACDDGSSGGTGTYPPNQTLTLSSIVKSVITMQNNDTAVPLEINALNIDSTSEDPADPNYTSLIGS